VAKDAAELRHNYDESGERELSYADVIHLATAVVHDDCGFSGTATPTSRGLTT